MRNHNPFKLLPFSKRLLILRLLLFLLAAFTLLLTSCGEERRYIPQAPKHEMPPPTVSTVEKGIMKGMTQAHNEVRARLGLPPLHWSERLAMIAARRARNLALNNNCRMRHTRSELGENLYWANALTWSDGRKEVRKIPARQVAMAWASEAADYDYSTNSCRAGAMCGHYTQMIWRDTTELGCGMAVCPDLAQIWVCVYYPPGNYIGMRPY